VQTVSGLRGRCESIAQARDHSEPFLDCRRKPESQQRPEAGQLRMADSSPTDGELVPHHDDFQFLEIVRLHEQDSELQNPTNDQMQVDMNTGPRPISRRRSRPCSRRTLTARQNASISAPFTLVPFLNAHTDDSRM
jgi:hypothetical protein